MMLQKSICKILGMIFLSSFSTLLMASEDLQTIFTNKYPETANTTLDNCATCHSPMIRDSLNEYGLKLKELKLDFVAIEALDVDKDGISTIDEISALTFPGSQSDGTGIFVFKNSFKPVAFNHTAHNIDANYGINGKCVSCHFTPGGFNNVFDNAISIKDAAHKVCKDCHQASGRNTAPTGCAGCHK